VLIFGGKLPIRYPFQELEKGYLIGPFIKPPFDIYRVSPIGIVEGKYSGKKQLILDLSAPHNNKLHSNRCHVSGFKGIFLKASDTSHLDKLALTPSDFTILTASSGLT
jgi:hypothetical protein